jgi:predicted nucleic acid-binding protein
VIFVDTSALYALADGADRNHSRATKILSRLLETGEPLVTHNYVLVESLALLQHRLGIDSALDLARTVDHFTVDWVDEALHGHAVRAFAQSPGRRVRLVDHVSFIVMRARRIEEAFAFDDDFEREGFRLYGF